MTLKQAAIIMGIVILVLLVSHAAFGARNRVASMKVNYIAPSLERSLWKRYKKRELSVIDTVVMHHSATDDGTPQSYAKYHVDVKKWPGIGYHFVIAKDGTIDQTQPLNVISYHASGENERSIGICLTGNYDKQQPPPEQLEAAIWLCKKLEKKLKAKFEYIGHDEVSSKSCPGANVSVAWIENKVHSRWDYAFQ